MVPHPQQALDVHGDVAAASPLGRRGVGARRGQSAVELALAIPVFLLLLFAVIDGARGMYAYVSLSNAAHMGARAAAEAISQDFGAPSQSTYNSLLASMVASMRGQLGIVSVDLSTTATATMSGTTTVDVHNSSLTVTGYTADGRKLLYDGTSSTYDETTVQCAITATFRPVLVGLFFPGGITIHTTASVEYPL